MKSKTFLCAIAALSLLAVLQTSCGTAKGFGRDLQTVGRGIEKVAR